MKVFAEFTMATLCILLGVGITLIGVAAWDKEARMQDAWEFEKNERIDRLYFDCVNVELSLPDGDPTRC